MGTQAAVTERLLGRRGLDCLDARIWARGLPPDTRAVELAVFDIRGDKLNSALIENRPKLFVRLGRNRLLAKFEFAQRFLREPGGLGKLRLAQSQEAPRSPYQVTCKQSGHS